MPMPATKPNRVLSAKRALLLLMAASSLALGACAGSGNSDYWKERPSSSNYMRLPVR